MPITEELDITGEQEPADARKEGRAKPKAPAAAIVKAWLQAAAATAVVFFLTVTFVVQGFQVYGNCMEPGLRTGERVLGNKLIYRFRSPARGDVIVFRSPADRDKVFIKRVIGLPGEVIEVRDGQVCINGSPLSEPYLVHRPHGSYGPEVIKPGHLFVMGDYRDQSNDSRSWGELPVENVQAKAWVRYWPLTRLCLMR